MRAWWPGLCGASGGRRRRTRRSAPRRESPRGDADDDDELLDYDEDRDGVADADMSQDCGHGSRRGWHEW